MTWTRRNFLTAAAAAALPLQGRASSPFPILTARPARQQLAPEEFAATPIWGFDGQVPGPEIRVSQGARVQRRIQNDLPQELSVHWHGIRIDNAMDGVPGLTQAPAAPGSSFDYDFVVPDAGTYWYHAHTRSMEQVARGLYGPLIVEEAVPPEVDQDITLLMDDWRLSPETVEIIDDFGNFHDLSHAGRLGNLLTINGVFDPVYPVRRYERVRLRLVNTANARVFQLALKGFEGWIVALDGMPLDTPEPLPTEWSMAPAQRVDIIADVTQRAGNAELVGLSRDQGYGLAQFVIEDEARPTRRSDGATLPLNPLPEIVNPLNAPRHEMRMTGGAMRGLAPSRLGATLMEPRELAQLGKFWALNGQVDRPETPFIAAALGETHRIAFVNETAFPHAMHLHGHHFRSLAEDGTLGPWRDTLLVPAGQSQEIVLVTDNPGQWLLHCHMLGHAHAGMISWITVTA